MQTLPKKERKCNIKNNHQLFRTQGSVEYDWEENEEEEVEQGYIVKMLLIGDQEVGKTNMLLRLADEVFSERYMPTIGIDFKIRTIKIDGVKVKVWYFPVKLLSVTNLGYCGSGEVHILLVLLQIESADSE